MSTTEWIEIMHLPNYSSLHVRVADGVATVELDHPPVNTLDGPMMLELHDLLGRLRNDDSTRVIVFESSHDEFFLAHVDFGIFDSYPALEAVKKDYPHVNVHQGIGELLRSQPQITIVKLAGIARAGGAEFVAAADMTFAGKERGKIAQSEVLLGILPGGGEPSICSKRSAATVRSKWYWGPTCSTRRPLRSTGGSTAPFPMPSSTRSWPASPAISRRSTRA